jgi:hypothetical protein
MFAKPMVISATVKVWGRSTRADLLGHFVGYVAAKRVYDHAATKRQVGEVVRLNGSNGRIAEASDLDGCENS